MKRTILAAMLLASTFSMAATQTLKNNTTADKNNEELRTALLNLNAQNNILNNLGENTNSDLVDDLANNNVNNGLNNLKTANN
ncbi:MAG: hypothetical protein L6Q33_02855 [Bacteriovoracaceae bacterium]|jgi:uncharacterized protein YlxW (UPF0749 family)|nr:hypothetical protein [Bacteriovoracaceae bacterium]